MKFWQFSRLRNECAKPPIGAVPASAPSGVNISDAAGNIKTFKEENMKYTITKNAEFGSLEVRFDEKPADTVRLALKRLKMRWHGVNKCWYGYASESELVAAILENAPEEQSATVCTDGYMGGGAVYGSKSNKALYGADLSAAIRADIKAAGIMGVTVKCKSYSGGQSITATIRTSAADYIDEADYIAAYRVRGNWVYDGERSIYIGDFYDMSAEEQERLRVAAARHEYARYTTTRQDINQYHIDKYTHLTATALERVQRVKAIIEAYRYGEPNVI